MAVHLLLEAVIRRVYLHPHTLIILCGCVITISRPWLGLKKKFGGLLCYMYFPLANFTGGSETTGVYKLHKTDSV